MWSWAQRRTLSHKRPFTFVARKDALGAIKKNNIFIHPPVYNICNMRAGSASPQAPQRNFIPAAIVLFIMIVTVSLVLSISPRRSSGDFDVYYDAGRNYLAKAPMYIPHGGLEEFKYSPLFALVFSPFALLPRLPALYLWSLFNIFLLYGMFTLLYRLKLVSFTRAGDLLLLICLFALNSRYIISNIKLGQVNILLCFLMFLTIYLEESKRFFWAAVVLAFSLMIKFYPLPLLFYFIITRKFRTAGYAVLMVLFFLLLPAAYSGFGLNLKYLREWFTLLTLSPAAIFYSVKNYSLFSFFSRSFIFRHTPMASTLPPGVFYAWAFSCLVFFSAFFYDVLFARYKDTKSKYLDYACLFVCGLLFNPLAYVNAFPLLIIPYFFILRTLFYGGLKKVYRYVVSLLVFLSFVIMVLYNTVFLRDRLLEYKPLMWTIILVYLSLWFIKLSQGGFRRTDGEAP